FDYAPFGITGLETELALCLSELHHRRGMTLMEVLRKYTIAPARLLNLPKGTLAKGADADVTLIDPDKEWVFDRTDTASKSFNSPFYGWPMKGKAVGSIVRGRKVWIEQRETAVV